MEGLRWFCSFALPFIAVYVASVWVRAICFSAWCIALALSLVSVGVLIEDWYVRRGFAVARPFLVAGVLLLVASVPVTLVSMRREPAQYSVAGVGSWTAPVGPVAGAMLAAGLILAIYFVVSLYTLVRAEGALAGHEGR